MKEEFTSWKAVVAKYKVTKWWHMPATFSQTGIYECWLELPDSKEKFACRKFITEDDSTVYEVTGRTVSVFE